MLKYIKPKAITMILTIVMVFTMIPMSVYADEYNSGLIEPTKITMYSGNLPTKPTINLINNTTGNLIIDWGDGSSNSIVEHGKQSIRKEKAYAYDMENKLNNKYTITISMVPETTGTYFLGDEEQALVIQEGLIIGGDSEEKINGNTCVTEIEAGNNSLAGKNSFQYSSMLTAINLQNCGTEDTSSTSGMFRNCGSLKTIIFGNNFNTAKVTDMSHMFDSTSITSLDLSNFNTSNVIDMSSMFDSCYFESLDLSNFNTAKVTNMNRMFYNCDELNSLNLSGFDTALASKKAAGMESFFGKYNDTYENEIIDKCSKLESITLGKNFAFSVGDILSYFPIPNSEFIPGATGKWYYGGNGYDYDSKEVLTRNETITYKAVPDKKVEISITGVVKKGNANLANVQVALLNLDGTIAKDTKGNDVEEVNTTSDGKYIFNNLKKGHYNIKVSNKKINSTTPVEIEDVSIIKNIKLLEGSGNGNTIVDVKPNTPQTTADLNQLFSQNDIDKIKNGDSVDIQLTAIKKEKSEIQNDVAKLDGIVQGKNAQFLYLDFTLEKK